MTSSVVLSILWRLVLLLLLVLVSTWLDERFPLRSGFFFSVVLTITPLVLALFVPLFVPRGPGRTAAFVVLGIVFGFFVFSWVWLVFINPIH